MPLSFKILRIVDWALHYENNRTREVKTMIWVPMPTKHDGDGYTELVEHENGEAHFGAWCGIVQVAAKCNPRGMLVRNSSGDRDGKQLFVTGAAAAAQEGAARWQAHDAESLARKTRMKVRIFREAIPRFLQIGWLEYYELQLPENNATYVNIAGAPQEGAPPLRLACARDTTPQDITEDYTTAPDMGGQGGGDKRDENLGGAGIMSVEVVAWLKNTAGINLTKTVRTGLFMHHWAFDELKATWRAVVGSRGLRDRAAVMASRIIDGEKVAVSVAAAGGRC